MGAGERSSRRAQEAGQREDASRDAVKISSKATPSPSAGTRWETEALRRDDEPWFQTRKFGEAPEAWRVLCWGEIERSTFTSFFGDG